MGKVVEFKRLSLREILEEVESRGSRARGVVSIIMDPDGRACFRISGFTGDADSFVVCGLLDWIKADLLADYL